MNIAGAELEIKGAKNRGNSQMGALDDMNWGGIGSTTRDLRSRHGGF
jgi:hypothetical protein